MSEEDEKPLKYIDYGDDIPVKTPVKKGEMSIYLSCCYRRAPRWEATFCASCGYICDEHLAWHNTYEEEKKNEVKLCKTILISLDELNHILNRERGATIGLKEQQARRQQWRQQRKTEKQEQQLEKPRQARGARVVRRESILSHLKTGHKKTESPALQIDQVDNNHSPSSIIN